MSEQDGRQAGGPTLNNTRQVTIDALCEHFANDVMDVEEFERRVELAHRAGSNDDLKDLLRDLPGGDLPAVVEGSATPAHRRSYRVTDAAHVEENRFVVAVLGGARRKGTWSPGRTNWTVSVMGGAELDFREAVMPPGVTTLNIFTMWGGVEVIVPPGLRVECHGIGIMGGFDHSSEQPADMDPDAPVLRIAGAAIMGGVDVSTRFAGETSREAKRRRRLERKERRRLRDGR